MSAGRKKRLTAIIIGLIVTMVGLAIQRSIVETCVCDDSVNLYKFLAVLAGAIVGLIIDTTPD